LSGYEDAPVKRFSGTERRARQAYLVGELCGIRPDGTTSFSLIQKTSDTGNSEALVLF